VFDVTGAGDTVVSVFTLARAVGAPYYDAAYLANLAASLVVAKLGTAVATKEELMDLVRRL
jgi:bifunctional ADP-heptose synthase (sugar kinase/adenylyltransferase)